MAGSIFTDTLRALDKIAERNPEIAVGFSGGKDSLAVALLCVKTFPVVRAFFFYTVPDLECCERQMRFAEETWGLKIARLPHWRRFNAMKSGVWCDPQDVIRGVDDLSLKEAFAYGMHVCGCEVMATGMKNSDGLRRRQFFSNIRDGGDPVWDRVFHPIREWRKKDVLDYLRLNDVPVPETKAGEVTSGVGLDHDSICWLADNHPEDFQKFLKWYPYAEAAIYRRKWYGLE